MSKNSNLHKAKTAKDDEFYTQLTDIEKEIKHYKAHFKGKTVFCNCDDPSWSNFYKYFALNFNHLGLEKLITTHYKPSDLFEENKTYKRELTRESIGAIHIDSLDTANKYATETVLNGDGDFKSEESIAILKEADIVVTNPPFSLFREYIATLEQYNKQYLIIGSMNAISYKDAFKLIKENKLWLGVNNVYNFVTPEGEIKNFGNVNWFTNLEHHKRNEELALGMLYTEKEYPKYDNYDAIEVSETTNIPVDYDGVMGVPISYLKKHNPEQFEIIGQMATTKVSDFNFGYPYVNGKKTYARILIKRK